MFLSELLHSAPGVNAEGRRYVAFALYPVREYMELILRVAQLRGTHAELSASGGLYARLSALQFDA